MSSLGSKIAATVIAGVCWIVFVLFWLAFFAGDFGFWQNLAIFIISVAIAVGAIAVMWIKWTLG